MGALKTLAINPSPIRERIIDAFLYNLIHLEAEDLPTEIRNDFKELCEKLTIGKTDDESEGSVKATVMQMKITDAIEIAQLIYSMYRVVLEDYLRKSLFDHKK